jgi:hypothetical protein
MAESAMGAVHAKGIASDVYHEGVSRYKVGISEINSQIITSLKINNKQVTRRE